MREKEKEIAKLRVDLNNAKKVDNVITVATSANVTTKLDEK